MRRLPRPGEVAEHCRLCAAVLVLTVENPRRVCANCGEINLPNDVVKVRTGAPLNAVSLPRISGREISQFVWGAGAPVFSAMVGLAMSFLDGSLRRGSSPSFPILFFVLLVATVGSFSRAVWAMTKDGARLSVITGMWVGGTLVGWVAAIAITWAGVIAGWLLH